MEQEFWKVTIQVGADGRHRVGVRVVDGSGKLLRSASAPVTRTNVREVVEALKSESVTPEIEREMDRASMLAWHSARHVGK